MQFGAFKNKNERIKKTSPITTGDGKLMLDGMELIPTEKETDEGFIDLKDLHIEK